VDDRTELLVELLRQQRGELREVITSLREVREELDGVRDKQEELAMILARYKGAFRVIGWVAGVLGSVATAYVGIRYSR